MNDRIILYLRVICASCMLFVIGGIVFSVLMLERVERITQVSENLNQKVNDIALATATLGKKK